jgi:hypothetical protein
MSSKTHEPALEIPRKLTVKDFLRIVPISRAFLSLEMSRGHIAFYKLGSRVLFEPSAVEAYLKSRERRAG